MWPFEPITLDAKAVHESIIVQVCPAFSQYRLVHIVLMDVKGKIYFIQVQLTEGELKFLSAAVKSVSDGIGCLSLKWIDASEQLQQYYKSQLQGSDEASSTSCMCSVIA